MSRKAVSDVVFTLVFVGAIEKININKNEQGITAATPRAIDRKCSYVFAQ